MIRVTGWVLRCPRTVIGVTLALTVLLGHGMRFMSADTDVTNDLPQRIEAKRLYDRIAELFPSREVVIVAAIGEDLLTVRGVEQLARLTRTMEQLPQVQSVLGPVNARIIHGTADGMEVREAADPLPRTAAEAAAFRRRILDQPLLRGTVVSEDGRAVAFLVFVKAGVREADAAEALIRVAGDADASQGLALHVAGRAAATYWSKIIMGRDMGLLSTGALVVVIVLLLVIFRSGRGLVFPLGVVMFSVVWTLGLMGYLGIPITHSTEVLPILLIAIGVADGIHILKGYYARARTGDAPRAVVRDTMLDLNRPVALTSVTTAIGFLALNTSGIESIMMLGFLTAFGVLAAMVFSLTFIPAALSLMKLPAAARRSETGERRHFVRLEAVAARYGALLVRRKGTVGLLSLSVVALAAVGATRVPVEMSNIDNFQQEHPLRVASTVINAHFGGTTNLVVVVETGREGGVKDPAVLAKMEALEEHLRGQPHVGAVQSIVGFVKKMHQALHGDAAEAYRLPGVVERERGIELVQGEDGQEVEREVEREVAGRDLVAQYLALYEMSGKPDDFANLVTYDYSTARLNVFIDSDRASVLDALAAETRAFIDDNFGDVRAELTGMAELLRAVNAMVITGQGWSIATSILLVLVATSLMFRSPTLGVFATLPLFFSLFLNFGTMGLSGIALNVMTMATSSVAVGVGIDYAIHFVHRYQQARGEGLGFGEAVPATMRASGVAIILNALTVAAGFMTLTLSQFKGVAQMGFLIALTMVTSAFAALTILPVIFVWLRPRAFAGGAAVARGQER